jgi:N utilization substance protein A
VNAEFLAALDQLEKERGITKEILVEAIEAALVSAFRRNFGSTQNVRVVLDPKSGDLKVLAQRRVVESVTDERQEISLAEARHLDPAYQVGDVVEQEVTPKAFGRIAAQTAKQVVMQRLREAERGILYEEFQSREGDVVTGVVQRYEHRTAYVDLGRTEAVLLPSEQIAGEAYLAGTRLKAYVLEVRRTTKGPQIMVSRTHPGLLKRLLELEVPEIREGVVEVKALAREAGTRSKIAVHSRDRRVDPIGACVGPKGSRINAISQELSGEKIDVIQWSEEPEVFVANALAPARVTRVTLEEGETRVARVVVPDYQLSLAIGKEGQNARLAAKLTGWRIDIRSEGGGV